MDSFDVDETTTRLKGALDINDLVDPDGKGVEFEVEDDEIKKEGDVEKETSLLDVYDKNQVASNILMLSDNEDDDADDDSTLDKEYLKTLPYDVEVLYRRLHRVPTSDITAKKDGGVLKQIKTLGIGNTVPANALVRVHYNAYLDFGKSPYDSTRLRGDSMKLRLGKGETLLGLDLAIMSMRKHEFSRFLIRYDYAFGAMGCPPRIPAKTTVIMEVEVLHFVEQEGVDDYYSLTREERRSKLTFTNIEKVVRAENAEGKEYFGMKNYNKAYGKFKKSINILQDYSCKNEAEEKESFKWKVKAYVNCAICSSNMSHYGRVISFCNQALELDRKNVKALYYKGKALHSVGDFFRAEQMLKAARNVDPTNTAVSKALKALAKSKKDHEMFEKEMCQRMFQQGKEEKKEASPDKAKKSAAEGSEETSLEELEELECSDRFKEIAQTALQTFNDDSSRTEMLFPPMSLNVGEIAFIVETAQSLGLSVRSKGTGNALRHEIFKRPPK